MLLPLRSAASFQAALLRRRVANIAIPSCSHSRPQNSLFVNNYFTSLQSSRDFNARGRKLSTKLFSTAATSVMVPETVVDPNTKFRKDYQPTPYLIETVHLDFQLQDEGKSVVKSKLLITPNPAAPKNAPLILNGRKDVELISVKLNGGLMASANYAVCEKGDLLTIHGLPSSPSFELEIETAINPAENSLLEGLYKSGGNFCTQCEAEGFRGITFFLDRPDIMAKYTTRMEAPKAAYPVLLGNGNLKESGDAPGGRHYAVWEDPFPKPCYLFALVAGNLQMRERIFKTSSGRSVALRIFVSEANINKVDFALESLIKSMKWDEDTFGLEYDLDLFNIVAVDDFNMGAMENKSLNIFNSRLVLASPETATDGDYARIEGVVGHEYFHNWTGNRVTCRDWFQLTLKEGLTVYRDQEFSADMNSRSVKRIEDVSMLRVAQFSQDEGPMAHPIRPDSYIKMDNFYTVTVYEKGAEVIRLYSTLLGKEGFRKGMDLYFKRHDGCAVTCDDFRAAMADANGVDLSSLGLWYSQAGTPRVHVTTQYDPLGKTYTLKAKQHTPASAGQPAKLPVLIPLSVGLLGTDGKDMPLVLKGQESSPPATTVVLKLDQEEASFTFVNIQSEPVPSILRDFSAPVKLIVEGQSDEHLLFLFAHDSDPFNRWESGQRLLKKLILKLYASVSSASDSSHSTEEKCAQAGGINDALSSAFKNIILDNSLDGTFKAYALSIPSAAELLDQIPNADPVVLYQVRMFILKELSKRLRPELEAMMKANDDPPGSVYAFNASSCARRAAKGKALSMLCSLELPETTAIALDRFKSADNMTDSMAALGALVEVQGPERQQALDAFYSKWEKEPLVVLKWLGLQAASNAPGNLELVKSLESHKAFNITNPNNCYSLFLAFARSPINFHAADGSGYQFMADSVIRVDKINHQVASRMVSAFTTFKQFDTKRQAMMKGQLERIAAAPGMSENVMEIVSKSLGA